MDFIVISAQTEWGVNGSRSSVLKVHFLFAFHTTVVTQPLASQKAQGVFKRIAD